MCVFFKKFEMHCMNEIYYFFKSIDFMTETEVRVMIKGLCDGYLNWHAWHRSDFFLLPQPCRVMEAFELLHL